MLQAITLHSVWKSATGMSQLAEAAGFIQATQTSSATDILTPYKGYISTYQAADARLCTIQLVSTVLR